VAFDLVEDTVVVVDIEVAYPFVVVPYLIVMMMMMFIYIN
jgi:hypothetical protein